MITTLTLQSSVTAQKETEPRFTDPGYRFRTMREKLSDLLFGCRNHNFSWPNSNLKKLAGFAYPKAFQAHQCCTRCGVERFYDMKTMRPGPQFIRTSPEVAVSNTGHAQFIEIGQSA